MASMPLIGHLEKLKVIATQLTKHGYAVTFFSIPRFRPELSTLDVEFVPFEGGPALRDFEAESKTDPAYLNLPLGLEKMTYEHQHWFSEPVAEWYPTIQRHLKTFRERDQTTPIVFVQESGFFGMFPYIYGAPGVPISGIVSVGTYPVAYGSQDTMPFGSRLPPDSSPEGRRRNKSAWETTKQLPPFQKLTSCLERIYDSLGAKGPYSFYMDTVYEVDRFLQLCVPEIEYPRSDLPKGFEYAGILPGVGMGDKILPTWWNEIEKHDKPVVVVSSGTLSGNAEDLILPTLQALKDMDVLVVSTLVNAPMKEGFEVPSNARVTKWIPFDELFKFTDVVVNNGGYGTVQQALSLGVPMVLAGLTEDKSETNARTAWSGAAIDLGCQSPSVDQLRDAIRKVLSDDKYMKRAQEMKESYARHDSIEYIIKAIDQLASSNQPAVPSKSSKA